jgi:hypothetical protein
MTVIDTFTEVIEKYAFPDESKTEIRSKNVNEPYPAEKTEFKRLYKNTLNVNDYTYLWWIILNEGVRPYLKSEQFRLEQAEEAKGRKWEYCNFYVQVQSDTQVKFFANKEKGTLSKNAIQGTDDQYFENSIHRKLKKYENDSTDENNGVSAKQLKIFFIAVHFWFHAFSEDKSYARKIDEKIIKYHDKFFQNSNIKKDLDNLKKKISEAEITDLVSKSDIDNFSGKKPSGLTKEQETKLGEELRNLEEKGLVYVNPDVPKLTHDPSFIFCEISANPSHAELECDGVMYRFKIEVHEIEVRFESDDVDFYELENFKCATDLAFLRYLRSNNSLSLNIKTKDKNIPLVGNQLKHSNGRLCEVSLKPDRRQYEIIAQHVLFRDHFEINRMRKIYNAEGDVTTEYRIAEAMEEDIMRLCTGTPKKFSSKTDELDVVRNES